MPIKLEKGVKVFDKKLRSLKPVLERWIRLMESYCVEWDWKDTPYNCGKRSNNGLIATAAWMSNGVALANYNDEEDDYDEKDIYLRINTEKFIAAFTYTEDVWIQNWSTKNTLQKGVINKSTDDAEVRLRDIEERELGVQRVYGSYIVPYANDLSQAALSHKLTSMLDWIRVRKQIGLLAYWFPKELRDHQNADIWDQEYAIQPGIMLIMNIA